MLEKFKQNFKSERVGNIFEKHNRGKDEIIRASYEVANLIARENKSFSDGEFVKKCILASVKEIIPEKMSVFENISLSRNTFTRRVEDIGGDLMMQIQIKSKAFKFFSLALDESTDVSDTAQLLIFIRGIDTDYNITEELASLESISGTTKGADIFEKVNCCIENLGLTWKKLCSITTDGAPNMVGRNTGLVGRIAELTTSKMIETPIFLRCIHQQSLCGKIMNLEHCTLQFNNSGKTELLVAVQLRREDQANGMNTTVLSDDKDEFETVAKETLDKIIEILEQDEINNTGSELIESVELDKLVEELDTFDEEIFNDKVENKPISSDVLNKSLRLIILDEFENSPTTNATRQGLRSNRNTIHTEYIQPKRTVKTKKMTGGSEMKPLNAIEAIKLIPDYSGQTEIYPFLNACEVIINTVDVDQQPFMLKMIAAT
ncbi:hypothetical protein QTP88_027390 [Uroleucon formosanum]